jgi:acetyl-CoA C-acetyltransferase
VRRVYLHGSAVTTSWADASKSLQDVIFDCTSAALRSAGADIDSIEAVVLGAHDLVDGRGLTNMVTAPAAGAYLKDEVRVGDDGATAFVLADARVRSGSVDSCLVVAWGRASEGPPDEISRALFDPFTTHALGMTEIGVSGLRASRALVEHPGYRAERDAAAARRRARPADPERTPAPAWPLRAVDLPVWSDVVAAAVLRAEPAAVEVLGVGMSTEPYELGDRELLTLPALRSASAQALREADRDIADMDVLELDGLTLFDEALAMEAVGAAGRGGGMAAMARDTRLDPTGASGVGYGAPAMGLTRIARAARRLLDGSGHLALATGSSVVAAQSQAAVVLGRVLDRNGNSERRGG